MKNNLSIIIAHYYPNSSDYKNSSFLGFNFYKKISDVFFIDFGFKKTKTNINPFIILRYNL